MKLLKKKWIIGLLGIILVSSLVIVIKWLQIVNISSSDNEISYIKHSILGPSDATYISSSDMDQDDDIDNDLDLDIIAVARNPGEFALFENIS